jgi:hypothetical protein
MYQIYGIAAAQNPDKSGETILIDGIDDSRLNVCNDDHNDSAYGQLGVITKHKKIHSLQECEDDHQKKCWNVAQVPFLYVEGLLDDENHQNGQAAAALIKFTNRLPDSPLKIGLSIEGGILQRGGHDDKVLEKTIATKASFTVKPCNPRCLLFPLVDLQKSSNLPDMPTNYMELLKKADATTSFIERKTEVIQLYMNELKKTMESYQDSFTSMKCHQCGKGIRFFRSGSSVPNVCPHCGGKFHLSQIWSAINAEEK